MKPSLTASIQRHVRTIDVCLFLAVLIGLLASWPFLTRPSLPRETDAELHVYRAAELGHALRGGVLYPRWAPNFFFAYGYPIFNYYAPFTYYLANAFDLLPGVDVVAGVKGVFVLGLVLASVGAYVLGRELFSPPAGLVAAAAFTFSPYILFIDPHARGVMAEHFAICLFPLAFCFLYRLLRGAGEEETQRLNLWGAVLTTAAIVFSHNLLGLVASGLLFAFWVWLVVTGVARGRVWWGPAAFGLAASIIAFFWIPAFLERNAVKLEVVGPGHFDFRENFLSLTELLAPSRILDLGATAPRYHFNLGLPQWVLALPALSIPFLPQSERKRTALFFLLAGLGLIVLQLPVSTPVWELVPGMEYLQFPWRLLGPTSAMLAVWTAGSTHLLLAKLLEMGSLSRWRGPILAVLLLFILGFALPLLYPPDWDADFGGTTPAAYVEWERRNLALGTTSTGDFLPVTAAHVQMRPAQSLLDSYQTAGPIDKVDRSALPAGARVEVLEHGPAHDRFRTQSPVPFTLQLYTFHFPGWQAYVDGERVEIEILGPEGFIAVDVPPGEREVLVRFENTPARVLGWVISAIGWGAMGAVTFIWRPEASDMTGRRKCALSLWAWAGGALLVFLLVKGWVIDPQEGWFRFRSPPGEARPVEYPLEVRFDRQIELLGYDLSSERVRPGDSIEVVLYWHALTPMETDYQSFVHLVGAEGLAAQHDKLNPADYPTTRWPIEQYLWDRYEIHVPANTVEGTYALHAGLYLRDENIRLTAYNDTGQTIGDSVPLATIDVVSRR